MSTPNRSLHVAYMINQYPKVSHSFIRREIVALEQSGIQVSRFAIRGETTALVDPDDIAELGRTRFLLQGWWRHLPSALGRQLLSRPWSLWQAGWLSIGLWRRSDRSLLSHLAYLLEGLLLADAVRRQRLQRIHAHFGTNSTDVAMLAGLLADVPYSFTVHGSEETDRPLSIGLAEKIRRADFVAAVSQYGRAQLCRWSTPAQWSKLHLVRCGLDPAFTTATAAPARPGNILCVGRLSPEKGQLILLQALALLGAEGIKPTLTLAGDGELRELLEQACRELGLEAQVRITGWISNAQVRNEIAAAQLLVVPSFAEGLPVVIMEAMALARPVLATYVAGIPELVIPEENGLLVPAGDVQALAGALQRLLSTDAETLAQMGKAGRNLVLRQHDVKQEAEKLKLLLLGGD